jgi:hypothetical protein
MVMVLVPIEASLDGVGAEAPAAGGREQRVGRRAGVFAEPGFEDRPGRGDERRASLLASLADGVHVRSGGEGYVAAGESCEFGDAQPGLDGEGEHGVIATSGPAGLVAAAEQRVDLVVGQVGDEVALGAFGGDGQHALDGSGVFGVVQREVAEQRVDRGEPAVARGDAVVTVVLEVGQERRDQRCVEFCDVERARAFAGSFGGKDEQEAEPGPVGGDGVGAGVALADQPIGEEGLQRRGERAHRLAPKRASSRSAASAISSGEADRYQ